MNHHRPNIDRQKEYGIAFGVAVLMSSPPSRSQMLSKHKRQSFAESGFGGRADEKIQTAREAPPLLGRKKSYPQHLTIARRHAIENILIGKAREQLQDNYRAYSTLLKYWRDEAAHGRASNIEDNEAYTSLALLLRLAMFINDNWDELVNT